MNNVMQTAKDPPMNHTRNQRSEDCCGNVTKNKSVIKAKEDDVQAAGELIAAISNRQPTLQQAWKGQARQKQDRDQQQTTMEQLKQELYLGGRQCGKTKRKWFESPPGAQH
jgi:uncharacterized protein YukE